jgi:hypothetical protein
MEGYVYYCTKIPGPFSYQHLPNIQVPIHTHKQSTYGQECRLPISCPASFTSPASHTIWSEHHHLMNATVDSIIDEIFPLPTCPKY